MKHTSPDKSGTPLTCLGVVPKIFGTKTEEEIFLVSWRLCGEARDLLKLLIENE